MHHQGKQLDFTGQSIYVGIDVGKRSWSVSIMTKDFEHKTFTQPPEAESLVKYLRKNFPLGDYKTVYEAGFSGYSAHEKFVEQGVCSMVVSPAEVPTKGSEKVRKTNPVDARKLSRSLRNGELKGIYVPSKQAREDRALVRMRHAFIKKQTRVKNQIKSFLFFHGIKLPEDTDQRYWSLRFIKWLESLTDNEQSSGSYALKMLMEELNIELRTLRAIMNVAKRWGYLDKNPFDGVGKMREDEKRLFMTSSELQRFFETLAQITRTARRRTRKEKLALLGPFYELLLNTGIRREEGVG